MAKWFGWIAALGGLISILNGFMTVGAWFGWLGGALAIIFGILAAMMK